MSQTDPAPQFLTLNIENADGRLRGNIAVPPGEMRLAEFAWNMMPLDDRLVGMSEKRHLASGGTISCTKGCGACCRQLVPVSPPEAWMLADLVAGMPAARRETVLERFAAIRQTTEESGWKEAFDNRDKQDGNAVALLGFMYYEMELDCPFLEEGSCSIHLNRPSICREYLVSSPAEECARICVVDAPIKRIPIGARLSEALANLTARLLGQEQPELIALTMALDWAAEHQEEGQRRWSGRELLEGLIAELSRQPVA